VKTNTKAQVNMLSKSPNYSENAKSNTENVVIIRWKKL